MISSLNSTLFKQLRIVLVETSHPGNIGGAARAMKNMGLDQLYLVKPVEFPSGQATARAAGADDLLANAVICQDLDEAIADCHLVFATSARSRHLSWPSCNPRECAEKIIQHAEQKIAILFGNEQCGLTNEQLMRSHCHVYIPTDEKFSSLNLAAAVQIFAYELRMLCEIPNDFDALPCEPLATHQELEGFHAHIQDIMEKTEFLNTAHPRMLMQRVRRLFNRSSLTKTEINILRGFFMAIGKKLENKKM